VSDIRDLVKWRAADTSPDFESLNVHWLVSARGFEAG